MHTKPDTGIPLIPFSHLEGWDDFAAYLTSIGIDTTPDALQARRRRYGLPIRGGGTKGKPVYFTTKELDAWMKHLRGCTLKAWLQLQQRRRDDNLDLMGGPPGRRAVAHLPLPAFDLYALTTRWAASPESLLRDADGHLYAARDPAVFSDVAATTVDDIRDPRAWRYYGMRWATPAELRGPATRGKKRTASPAGRVVGAVVRVGNLLRWCRVPGPLLGLPKGTTTLFLAAWGQPGFTDAVGWIQQDEPDVLLVVWDRRQEVEPFALEELPLERPYGYLDI